MGRTGLEPVTPSLSRLRNRILRGCGRWRRVAQSPAQTGNPGGKHATVRNAGCTPDVRRSLDRKAQGRYVSPEIKVSPRGANRRARGTKGVTPVRSPSYRWTLRPFRVIPRALTRGGTMAEHPGRDDHVLCGATTVTGRLCRSAARVNGLCNLHNRPACAGKSSARAASGSRVRAWRPLGRDAGRYSQCPEPS